MFEADKVLGLAVGSVAGWRLAGLSRRQLESRAADGRLVRVRRGAYATAGILGQATATFTDENGAEGLLYPGLGHAIQVAAVLATSREAAVGSHESAARVHGLSLLSQPDPGGVTVTVPPGRPVIGAGRSGITCHVAALPEAHRAVAYFGVPVTSAARTVADIARSATFRDGVVVTDCALHGQVTTTREIQRVLADCKGWPGVEKARRVTDFATGRAESVLESCARVAFHEHGLPAPELQAPVLDRTGKVIARPDFTWPQYGTIAETDGIMKYRTARDIRKHFARDARLDKEGWEVIHITWAELSGDEAGVIARIRASFARGTELGRGTGLGSAARLR